jgi:fermentation-respiration switch protein FrsA (DUF1100 family)
MPAAPSAVVKNARNLPWPWRIARQVLRISVVVYLVICLLVYFCQNWLAFPGASSQGMAETAIDYRGSAEVLHLKTADGIPIGAVFGTALNDDGSPLEHPDHCPTILYFYGNASSVASSEGEFDHMRKLGANVLIPDLAGFGASGGKASEANFYATADAGWDYLMQRRGIDRRKVVAVGWSMGAAVAIDLARRKPVAGLAMFNAFTDLPAMAHQLFPYLPTSLLLKYRFDNLAKIREIDCPIFICNGEMDSLVPPGMSDELATAARMPVTRLRIRTADHNSIFTAEPETVWPALRKFVQGIAEK